MAYNKKYAKLGESVIDYVNDREDAIEQGFDASVEVTILPPSSEYSPMRLAKPGFYWAQGGWMTGSGHAPSPFGMVFAWEVGTGNRFVVFIGTDNVTRTRVLFNGTWSDWKTL